MKTKKREGGGGRTGCHCRRAGLENSFVIAQSAEETDTLRRGPGSLQTEVLWVGGGGGRGGGQRSLRTVEELRCSCLN